MAFTNKEVMLIQDNIRLTQNSIKFLQGCAEIATDAQVKGMCQSMARDQQTDLQTLIKYVNSTTVQ